MPQTAICKSQAAFVKVAPLKSKSLPALDKLVLSYQKSQSRETLAEIMRKCSPMVNFIAHRASLRSKSWILDKEDLVSAGNIGLTTAVSKYDKDRGSFRSFAFLLVDRAISSEIRAGWSISDYKYQSGVKQEPFREEECTLLDRTNLGFFELLESCQGALTDQELCVVVCHYSEGLRFGVVAKILGMPNRRVSRLHQSALTKIASSLNAR